MSEGFKPREPDYKGLIDVAAWISETKEGKTMITLKIGNAITAKLYKNEPKPKEQAPSL